eukprot:2895470-Lingulodinium_polyedra.AAC.1
MVAAGIGLERAGGACRGRGGGVAAAPCRFPGCARLVGCGGSAGGCACGACAQKTQHTRVMRVH